MQFMRVLLDSRAIGYLVYCLYATLHSPKTLERSKINATPREWPISNHPKTQRGGSRERISLPVVTEVTRRIGRVLLQ